MIRSSEYNHTLRIKALYNQVADSLLGKGIYSSEVISESILNEKEQLDIVERELNILLEEINDTNTLKNSLNLRFKEFCNLLKSFSRQYISPKA